MTYKGKNGKVSSRSKYTLINLEKEKSSFFESILKNLEPFAPQGFTEEVSLLVKRVSEDK